MIDAIINRIRLALTGTFASVDNWEALSSISRPGAFTWPRPEHMEPLGDISLSEVRVQLQKQLDDCLNCLRQLDKGQGILYKTTMTVNGLGKLDVYHYIYFLCQHARRHIVQMQTIADEFNS